MLELRPLGNSDIPLAEAWLNKAHVKRWYEIPLLGVTIDDWISEIKAYKGAFQWITYLIVLWERQPIGLCLYYRCEDSKGEDFGILPLTGSYGIDYFIGEESQLGKGFGKGIIRLLSERIFSLPDAQRITADVDRSNEASIRALLSNGFTLLDAQCSRYVYHRPEE